MPTARKSLSGGKRRSRRSKRSKRSKRRSCKGGSRKSSYLSGGKKRSINEYFKLMLKAKANGDKSFKYKGNTYYAKTTKTGMVIYAKK